jgi:fimbrial chaperone protein
MMGARRTIGTSGSWFVAALAMALFCSAASAATFGLSPLRVDLSGTVPTAVLTLTNGGDTPVTLQIQARTWRQVSGRDEQEPTTDFIVNPAAVTVLPGGEQIVRIALRAPPDRTTERAYRLVVREVPVPEPGAAPGSLALRMALAMDIPAYVAPVSTDGVAIPSFALERSPEGAIQVRIANQGERHLRLTELTITQGTRTLAEQNVFVVLPGVVRHLPLPSNALTAGEPVKIRAQSNVGSLEATLEAVPRR